MDAGQKIREYGRQYGNILRTIRRAEGLERAIRAGAPKAVIERKVATYKQAVAKSGPVVYQFRGAANGVSMGRRV